MNKYNLDSIHNKCMHELFEFKKIYLTISHKNIVNTI
jgi:hypothetical protein